MSIWSGLETQSLFKAALKQFVRCCEAACPALSTRGALLQPRTGCLIQLRNLAAVSADSSAAGLLWRGGGTQSSALPARCGVCVPLGGTVRNWLPCLGGEGL